MEHAKAGDSVFLRLVPGESTLEKLLEAARLYGAETLVIEGGLGAFQRVELAYFVEKGVYESRVFHDVELLSLNGVVSRHESDYFAHVHAVISDKDMKAWGGHLKEGIVRVTHEIVLRLSPAKLLRREDPDSGLLGLHPT